MDLDELRGRTDAAIRSARMRPASLRVVGPAGPVPPGTAVRIEQTGHDFRFGVNLVHWGLAGDEAVQAAMEERAAGLFNYATLPFYWGQSLYGGVPPYEPERGVTARERLAAAARWCRGRSLRVKGHPLVFYREPAWLASLTPAEREAAYWRRIAREAGDFAGLVDAWEVVNEPAGAAKTCGPAGAVGMQELFGKHGAAGVISRAHALAHDADPGAELIQNDCNESDRFAAICREAIALGARIDAIGIQHHAIERPAAEAGLRATLDRFAGLGRPVHVTEVMIPSGSDELRRSFAWRERPEWVSTPEGERRQAEEAEALYRVLFSHPAVAAVTWWDLSDRGACLGIPCGLLRRDMSPKPAFEVLMRLVHEEWRTRARAVVGPGGLAEIEGFPGRYRAEAEVGGRALAGSFGLPDRPAGEIAVDLG